MAPVNGKWSSALRQQSLVWGLAGGLGLSLFLGCSRTPPAPVASQSEEPAAAPAKEHGTKGHAESTESAGQRTAANKRPMIGDIPVDVWLDNPIAESKKTGAAGRAPSKSAEPAVAAKPTPMPEPAKEAASAATAGDDWASVISAEELRVDQEDQDRTDRQFVGDWQVQRALKLRWKDPRGCLAGHVKSSFQKKWS